MKRVTTLSILMCVCSLSLLAQTAATARFTVRETGIDQVCASYNNYQSAYIVECDYPMGEEPAANAIRTWINEKANYWEKGLYGGDMLKPMELLKHYMAHFAEDNSAKKIEQHLTGEAGGNASNAEWSTSDEPEWFYRANFKKEYISAKIVSYTYSWYAFFVGNATSNASIEDASFSRLTGERLSWDMFTSKESVCRLVKDALKKKYGDGADLYNNGIPEPKEPLFLEEGVRFDYGDYSVGEPHYYEEHGEYPSCLISYDQLQPLLTDKAKSLLGR